MCEASVQAAFPFPAKAVFTIPSLSPKGKRLPLGDEPYIAACFPPQWDVWIECTDIFVDRQILCHFASLNPYPLSSSPLGNREFSIPERETRVYKLRPPLGKAAWTNSLPFILLWRFHSIVTLSISFFLLSPRG